MKEISWFIQRIGVQIKGSHHTEPFIINNAAHASRLFVAQNSVNHAYDEHFEDAPAVAVVAPQLAKTKKAAKHKK